MQPKIRSEKSSEEPRSSDESVHSCRSPKVSIKQSFNERKPTETEARIVSFSFSLLLLFLLLLLFQFEECHAALRTRAASYGDSIDIRHV